MLNFTFFQRVALLVSTYFSLVAVAAAQGTQYASSVVQNPAPVRTTDPAKAADQDTGTFSNLLPQLVTGLVVQGQPASERVQFPAAVSSSANQSGIYMRVNNMSNGGIADNLLMASLANNITVNSYKDGRAVDSWSLGKLIDVQLLGAGKQTTLMLPASSGAFNQLELVASGTANAYSVDFFEAFAPAAAAPLPVQLVSFQGRATSGGVQLSWQTASELNNSHFVVERASGSQASEFIALTQVTGHGSCTQAHSYQFTDAAPTPVNYYRLRQVDMDGHATYSATVAVSSAAALLAAYPSPATTTLTVATANAGQLSIFNQQGQLVQQTVAVAGSQALDISSLPVGLYFLHDASTGQRLRFEKAGQ